MGQLLTCSIALLSCQRRPSWETEMKTCSSQLWFHGLESGKSVHKISDPLWFADRSRLYLILNKNWCVHSLTKLIIFDVFEYIKTASSSYHQQISEPSHIIPHNVWLIEKSFNDRKRNRVYINVKNSGIWSARIGIFRIRAVLPWVHLSRCVPTSWSSYISGSHWKNKMQLKGQDFKQKIHINAERERIAIKSGEEIT
jgi:hypothetical protein